MRNYDNILFFVDKLKNGSYEYKEGVIYSKHTGKPIKGTKRYSTDYLNLDYKNTNYRYRARIHLIIFAYFHGIDELRKHETIDHIDGDKYNNRIENLQGMSAVENIYKYLESGGYKKSGRKLSKIAVISIRESDESDTVLSKIHGVSRKTVYDIKKGLRYKQYL